jgi:hypothetical protein
MLNESKQSEFWENGVVVVESALSAEALKPLREQHQQSELKSVYQLAHNLPTLVNLAEPTNILVSNLHPKPPATGKVSLNCPLQFRLPTDSISD